MRRRQVWLGIGLTIAQKGAWSAVSPFCAQTVVERVDRPQEPSGAGFAGCDIVDRSHETREP